MENNLYKKLKFFALCLAIICMLLSLIKHAKAEEIDSSLVERYYSEQFLQANNINDVSILNTIAEKGFIYFIQLKYNDNIDIFWITKGKIACPFDFDINNNVINNVSLYKNFGYNETYYNAIDGTSLVNLIGQGKAFGFYVVYNHLNKQILSCTSMGFSTDYDGTIANYNGTRYNNFIQSGTIYYNATRTSNFHYYVNVSYEQKNINSYDTKANYHDYWFKRYDNAGNVLILDNYFDLNKYYPSKNTDGLKVYKQTIHNQSFLYIDYSDLQNIAPTYLEKSSVFGNINVDGTIFEIDYDSSSPYYHINLSSGKVYYQIPFSSLEIDDENIESAILTDLEVNVSWSTTINNGENKYLWVTPLYLIGSPHETPGYTPDSSNEQPQQTYTPEMNAEYYLNLYSMYHDGHTGNPFKYDSNINIYSSHQAALNSIKLNCDLVEIDTWYISSTDKTLYASNTDYFSDYIYDNGYGLYYDAIVFDVYDRHVDGVVSPVNEYKGTGVFFTEKYYVRNGLMSCTDSLKDVVQYDKMCSDYLYLLYDVTWKKLKSIDYNTSDFFTKQGTLTQQIILILENINSFLPDLSDILNNILDKLNDLHLSQLDSIDTKLSTIIDNITEDETPFNEDDTISEAIAYYQSHTQAQAVLEDKYSVWFTGYCHFWLQEYGEEEPINNTRSTSRNVSDFASTEKRHILFRTFKVITNIYDKMQEDLLFNRVEELFDYMLDTNSDVSHTRRSYFYDVFNEKNTPTLDYNPYE